MIGSRAYEVLTPPLLEQLPSWLQTRAEFAALRYAVLGTHGNLDRLDADSRRRARSAYASTLARNTERMERLDEFLVATRARNLRVVLLKGALLARSHYGDLGARAMLDLDVACDPADLAAVVSVASEIGFSISRQADRAPEIGHDVSLSDGRVDIDCHFRLWHELGADADVGIVTARAKEVHFGAHVAWAPHPEDHLFFVLVHAAAHGFSGNPLWITDAVLLAHEAGGGVWARVSQRAAQLDAKVAVAAACDFLMQAVPQLGRIDVGVAGKHRRRLLQHAAPWLQTSGVQRAVWASRMVRPLIFDRNDDLFVWAMEKIAFQCATTWMNFRRWAVS